MCYSYNLELLISPELLEWTRRNARAYGPSLAGACFGGATWAWTDAVVLTDKKPPFVHWLPAVIAILACIMINLLQSGDDFGFDGGYDDNPDSMRARIWLFLSYVVSIAAIIAAVWSLVANYTSHSEFTSAERWPGVAMLLTVFLILSSGILYFFSRNRDSSDSYNYGTF
jgi:hypothetical protein